MQKIEYFTVCNDSSNFMTPVQKSIYAKLEVENDFLNGLLGFL